MKFEIAKERRLERERKVAEKKAMKNLLVSILSGRMTLAPVCTDGPICACRSGRSRCTVRWSWPRWPV